MWPALLGLWLAANPWLEEGQRHFEALRYPEAAAALRTALDAPTNSVEERRKAGDLLARALLAQGKQAEAEAVWAGLLAKDSELPDPVGVSPKVREAFWRAKEKVYPRRFVRLEARPAAQGQLAASVVDPWRLVARVHQRLGPAATTELNPVDGVVRTELAPGSGSHLLEALDAQGALLASLTVEAPPKVEPAPAAAVAVGEVAAPLPSGPPRWPAWTAAVLGVGALGAAAAVGISSGADFRASRAAPDALTARSLDERSRSKALAANVLVGAGAAASAGAAALFVWSY